HVELNFLALSMWLWGGMFYIWIISLVFYRYSFFALLPQDLTPAYWINMGAMAISVLAGTLLMQNAVDTPLLASVLPFIKGFTVFYWATATWWIPMLLVLTLWRHLVRRFPFVYEPQYWAAVFPLGMYAVATEQMAAVLELPFLNLLPPGVFAATLAAWTFVFVGLLRALGKIALRHRG
ncbi:MAG TPA: tellurite resistance/C4-dicarboxylate transporter family protein, partial [Burkholderiaceae bacterium]|nr:tellurite resistance/C4-dicarboxylate transporter family protein [Burkholderiaceae bacterium]